MNRATEVKDLGKTLPKGTALMMKYYTPWCSHCTSLGPSLEIAMEAVNDWDSEDVHPTVFGQMDCEAHGADCKKLGVKAFPTMKFYNNEGNVYLEYPRLPRSADSLTAFLARYRRIIKPYPITLRDIFAARDCSPDLKFRDSICRGFRIENYLVGGSSEVFEDFNKFFKHAPSAFLEFIDPKMRTRELCLIDRFTGETRYCVDHFDSSDEKVVTPLREAMLPHRHPYVIENASWFDFFHLRDVNVKKYIVILPDGVMSGEQLREIAQDRFRDFNFITVSGDALRIFDQTGKAGDGALVMPSNVYDKSFFHLSADQIEDLSDWLWRILMNKIPKQFPPGSRSEFQEFKDSALSMIQFVRHGFSQLSLRRKIQIFLTALALGLAWIYLVIPVGDDESQKPAAASKALAKSKPKFSKRSASGVCLVNGEVISLDDRKAAQKERAAAQKERAAAQKERAAAQKE